MMANNPHNEDYSTGHRTEQRSLLENILKVQVIGLGMALRW